jgi:uncharacterized membrane protein YhaH (DUF805 family)
MGTISRHFKSFTDFTGRETRREFWLYAGLIFVGLFVGMALIMIASILATDGFPRLHGMVTWFGLLTIAAIGCLAAAVARRLHDRGLSGAWGTLPLPFLAFSFFAMDRVFASLGEEPSGLFEAAFVSNLLYNISLIVLIVLLIGPSDEGANRFGDRPCNLS